MRKLRSNLSLVAEWVPRQWAENGTFFLVSLGVAGLLLVPVVSVGIVCSGRC